MSLILGQNYDVAYPVNFYSGGDTTRDAFLKHIQEIERIYGALTALDAGKASSTEMTNAISNALANFSPTISGNNITGNIAASKIVGELTNASINTNNVNGLLNYVNKVIKDSGSGTGDGIVGANLQFDIGYIKFNNGFMLQWGGALVSGNVKTLKINFNQAFTSSVYFVTACSDKTSDLKITSYDSSGFTCETASTFGTGTVRYFAIGV